MTENAPLHNATGNIVTELKLRNDHETTSSKVSEKSDVSHVFSENSDWRNI